MEHLEELSDDEDFVELVQIMLNRRKRQNYRERPNHFNKWTDKEFHDRFRLSKTVVRFIINRISDTISPNTNRYRNHERNHTLSPAEMVLITLRFFATGSFVLVSGDFSGIDRGTASRVIHKVTLAIARLKPEYINMPTLENDLNVVQDFFNLAKFPRCIGALDCTHVKIMSSGGPNAEQFRNRKGFFSVNVQVVCNAKLEAQNVVCRWPGSTHDSTIVQNSTLRVRFENGEFGDSIIVGDGGYSIKPYLLTPLNNTQTDAENLFNESQIRNPIERYFGIWKRRFPILALGIQLDINKIESIIAATTVLQNIAQSMNDNVPSVNDEFEAAVEIVNNINIDPLRRHAIDINNRTRVTLVHEYCRNLLEL